MVGFETDSAVSRNMLAVLLCSFVFFFGPVHSQILELEEGAPCEALGGEEGTCQLLTDCHNPGDFKVEHPPICTFRGRVPIICCAVSTGIREEDFRFKYGSNKAAIFCKNHTTGCDRQKEAVGSAVMVAGKSAIPYVNNFMAVIGYGDQSDKVWKCGGTLITSRFILSAASCSELKDLGPARWARIGSLEILSSSLGKNNNVKEWEIVERIGYPDYKEPSLYHDIALFQLLKEVPFDMWVGPVCLHNGREVKGEVTANVWGKAQANLSPELLESKMIIDDDKKCQRMTIKSPSHPEGAKAPLMFCASVKDHNPNYCPMETAGGPILVREKDQCLTTQIGIASYRKESCGETNYPTVYTRVSQYLSWIESIVFHVIFV